jgi:hypothetical protein
MLKFYNTYFAAQNEFKARNYNIKFYVPYDDTDTDNTN